MKYRIFLLVEAFLTVNFITSIISAPVLQNNNKIIDTINGKGTNWHALNFQQNNVSARSIPSDLNNYTQKAKNLLNGNVEKALIAVGIKNEPTIVEKLYHLVIDEVEYILKLLQNKLYDVQTKGLTRTLTDTISISSRDLDSDISRNNHDKNNISLHQNDSQSDESVMETRDLDSLIARWQYKRGGSYGRNQPWDRLFHQNNKYKPHFHTSPFHGVPFGFIGDFFLWIINSIRDAFYYVMYGPAPSHKYGLGFHNRHNRLF